MNRYIKVLSTVVVVFSLLFGFSSFIFAAEGDSYIFGISLWADSGPLAKDVIDICRFAAETLGSKLEVVVDGFVPERQVANIENFIARGVDAIIIPPCADAVVPKLVKLCEDAQVPLVFGFRSINDPAAREYAEKSKYYLGNCHEDEESVGYNLGKILAEKGSKNAVIINYNRGDTTAEARYRGYVKAFEETGVTLLGEQWDILTADKSANAAESFIAAFPELDAIAIGGGGGEPLEGAIQAVKKNNKIGAIQITASDFGPNLLENVQNQEISAQSGGHHTDALFAFMLAFNFVDGTPLSDKSETLTMDPIYVSSVEEVQDYFKYCVEQKPYSPEEIKNMTVRYNPDFTFEKLKEIAANYSLKDLKARHGE